MTIVRSRLTNELCAKHTYGYITKYGRIALKLDKTHYSPRKRGADAFVIAGGSTAKRAAPIKMCQKRGNNRKLQRFYDAKYIDLRTVGTSSDKPKTASGQELSSGRRTRNKNKSGPNLRIYRGKKVRKGRKSIRRKRYPLQPLDYVQYQGQMCVVKGTHSYGRYVRLMIPNGEVINAKVLDVTPWRIRSGIYIE